MRRVLFLAAGWSLVIVGLICLPLPCPPFPPGILLMPLGATVLTAHSRSFRRLVQHLRYRHGWVSVRLEQIAVRAPERIKTVVTRTDPRAIVRAARMRAMRPRAADTR